MKFTAKTEYGLVCLIYMAHKPEGQPVTTTEIVQGEGFSKTFTEKILQKLRTEGIVTSVQGNQGGYVLARKSKQITLRQIVEALEGTTFQVFCEPKFRSEIVCNHYRLCGLKSIWTRTKDLLDGYFGGVTLDQLAGMSGGAIGRRSGVPVRKAV